MYPSPASDYLAALYHSTSPLIDESFPIASDEFEYESKLLEGFWKVANRLVLINDLCRVEERVWRKVDTELDTYPGRPCFPMSSFGYLIVKDAALLAEALQGFTPNQEIDYEGLFEQLYDYMKSSLEIQPLTIGDFFDYCRRGILALADRDFSNESYLIIGYIADVNDPACDFSNNFHREILNDLSIRSEMKQKDLKVFVERVYVGYLMSIVATDDGVEFWKYAESYQLEGDKFDNDYIDDAIYRNDKIAPSNAEEWLDLITPVRINQTDYNQGIALGRRAYLSIEEARKVENAVMGKAQRWFKDFDE